MSNKPKHDQPESENDAVGKLLDIVGKILGTNDDLDQNIDLFELAIRAIFLIVIITIALIIFGILLDAIF